MRFPDDVPVLGDEGVTLRPHRLDDVDAITEQCRDEEMQRFTLVPAPYSRVDAVAFVSSRAAGWEDGSRYSFAIEAPEGAGPTRFAGSVALHMSDAAVGEVAFGVHPAARGHGVMTSGLGLLADWAFQVMGVRRLGWSCLAGNTASWRVAWRNGFRFEGATRRSQLQRGTLVDSWNASLLPTDPREPSTKWLAQPRLSNGVVVLRPNRAEDVTRYLETVLDAETDLWLSDVPLLRDRASYGLRLRDGGLMASLGRSVEWAIADPVSDEYVGGLALFGFDTLDHLSAEVGYRAHPAARGRGYVSGALRLALSQSFRPEAEGGYALARVSLGAGVGNAASQAVAISCGFTETGRDRCCYRRSDGDAVDLVRFDLLADEWREVVTGRPAP